MKKFLTFFLLLLTLFSIADARRGCCSHHGGVCGCMCCDGSALSAKCAPYYPTCDNSNAFNDNINYYNNHLCPENSNYSQIYKGCICNKGFNPSKDYTKCIKETK